MRGFVFGFFCLIVAYAALNQAAAAKPSTVADQVVIDVKKPVNVIVPDEAVGAAIDGMGRDDVNQALTPFNIKKMKSAGIRRVTYRTRPELGIEAWHWTEEGHWSDDAHQQGYWTSSDNPSQHPRITWGYSLPRRGDSVDQANDQGYSRLDDGDPASFWKSNPYLDRSYTGAAENRPQWIVVSFDAAKPIDAARIQWAAPYATHFLVQYWQGKTQFDHAGRWVTFPNGDRTLSAEPDDGVLSLADTPVDAKFLRILLLQSSLTAPAGSTDPRDRLGYAVREVSFGVSGAGSGFTDAMTHGKSRDGQTLIQVSSTDPWHRAIDRDLDTEQPNLDLIFGLGLNGGLPMMAPVGVFYDIPDNAAAEVRYLKRRGYPVKQIELGEEPDGQFIDPEDYADLYLETAKALHAIDPTLSLGGPSMQGAITDTWPDPADSRSWTKRFVARLKDRGGLDQLGFFSFEHYPFDDVCEPIGKMLRDETDLMDQLMDQTAADGMPTSIPWIISEYGFSPFAGRAMSEIPSALLSADIVGHFLTRGGTTAFMLGYTPSTPSNQIFPCAGYGDMMLFEADGQGRSRWAMPMYYAARMMLQDWGAPANQTHSLYAARSEKTDAKGRQIVVAYPLRSKDGRWSIMLVNRDPANAHRTRIVFRGAGPDQGFPANRSLSAVQYSPADYAWLAKGEASHPTKDLPPERYRIDGGKPVLLPAFSLTVISGDGPAPQ